MRTSSPVHAVLFLTLGCAAPRIEPAVHPAAGARTTEHSPAAHAAEVAHAAEAAHAAASDPRLQQQIDHLRAATARYREHEHAVADGFRRFGRESALMGEHWYRRDLVQAPLDLTRPSTLQYALIDGRRVLVGVAYTVYQRPGQPLPTGFTGDADHWHVHDVAQIAQTATRDRPVLRWIVSRRAARGKIGGGDGRTQLVMVHAWPWLDNPDGMFAQQHRTLPYLRLGLPAWVAARGDAAAAHGVALLSNGSCQRELERIRFLAQPSRAQTAALRTACDDAAARLAHATAWRSLAEHRLPAEPDARATAAADRLHAVAAAAWLAFVNARDTTLTPEQRRRLDSIIEHPATMH